MSNRNQAEFFFKRAETIYGKGEYQKAIEFYDRVIDLCNLETIIRNEFLGNSLLQRAFSYWHINSYQQAIEDCDQIIAFAPNNPYAWAVRGLSYAGLGDKDEAAEDLSTASEIEPDDVWILKQIINFYSADHHYSSALPYAEHLHEIRPTHLEYALTLGKIYLRAGKTDKSLEIYLYTSGLVGYGPYQTSQELRGKEDLWVNGGLGAAYRRKKELETALSYLDVACPDYCDIGWIWAERGYVYDAQGKYTEALSDFKKALSLDNSMVNVKFAIARCQMQIDKGSVGTV